VSARYQLASTVRLSPTSVGAIVLDESTGQTAEANIAGAIILEACVQTAASEEIAAALARAAGCSTSEAMAATEAFVASATENGWLIKLPTGQGPPDAE
jgi:hypothetical protein